MVVLFNLEKMKMAMRRLFAGGRALFLLARCAEGNVMVIVLLIVVVLGLVILTVQHVHIGCCLLAVTTDTIISTYPCHLCLQQGAEGK